MNSDVSLVATREEICAFVNIWLSGEMDNLFTAPVDVVHYTCSLIGLKIDSACQFCSLRKKSTMRLG